MHAYSQDYSNCTDEQIKTNNICSCNIAAATMAVSDYNNILNFLNLLYAGMALTYEGMHGEVVVGVNDEILMSEHLKAIVVDAIRNPSRYIHIIHNERFKSIGETEVNEQDFKPSIAYRNLRSGQRFVITLVPLSKFRFVVKQPVSGERITVHPKEN